MTAVLEVSPLASAHDRPATGPQDRTKLAATIIDYDWGVLVRVEGEAGIVGVAKLQLAFARVTARRALLAVLDLSHLTFVSSLAIGELVRLRRDLRRWYGCVKIANCPLAIRQALETAGLADLFGSHASVEEAILAI
jgi:anti-anti-sigma factor